MGEVADELIDQWTLVAEDRRLIGNKTGPTRLGFALMLKFFEREARFPQSVGEFPDEAVSFVASQVDVDSSSLARYRWEGRTVEYHRAQIRNFFGFREFSREDEHKLAEWLASEVCPVELRDGPLREAVLLRCRTERVEPPGRVDRLIGAARAMFEESFCSRAVSLLSDACIERLEALVGDVDRRLGDPGLLAELKADPGQLGLETLLREIGKLNSVRAIVLPDGVFGDASEKLVESWRARAARMYPSDFPAYASTDPGHAAGGSVLGPLG